MGLLLQCDDVDDGARGEGLLFGGVGGGIVSGAHAAGHRVFLGWVRDIATTGGEHDGGVSIWSATAVAAAAQCFRSSAWGGLLHFNSLMWCGGWRVVTYGGQLSFEP